MKTYLIKDQVRLLKRKTSITRQSVNPVYNCKIKYSGCEVHNSELLVSSNVNTYTYIRQFLSLTAILIHAPVPAFFRLYIYNRFIHRLFYPFVDWLFHLALNVSIVHLLFCLSVGLFSGSLFYPFIFLIFPPPILPFVGVNFVVHPFKHSYICVSIH